MSRPIFTAIVACSMLLLGSTVSRAQQPMAIISVDWNHEAVVGPQRTDLIHKSLRAAFADTLKKKLNVNDPATVADLDMMVDRRNIRLLIMPKGAVQPTQGEILAAVKESFLETVTTFFNDFHARG